MDLKGIWKFRHWVHVAWIVVTLFFFNVLLTMHLSIILVIDQINALILVL